jgi:hypothetical protein
MFDKHARARFGDVVVVAVAVASIVRVASNHSLSVSLLYPSTLQLERAEHLAPFASLDAVACSFVDTPAALADMMSYLEGTFAPDDDEEGEEEGLRVPRDAATGRSPVCEVALDLEAHSVRSFQGFVCLMQLSTRRRDFLVDALALRSHLHAFNRIAADPAVLKVRGSPH